MLIRFEEISKIIGFTKTEFRVLVFLTASLLLGAVLHYWGYKPIETPLHSFNYAKSDSSYNSAQVSLKNVEKRVDSKQELLDFSVNKSTESKADNKELLENSININIADIERLMKLPGVGIKTAERIVQLRNQRSGFTEIDEMLDVKGIGEIKFSRIKKYIFVGK